MGDTTDSLGQPTQGSWLPLILVAAVLVIRWLVFGDGPTPVRIRRWYNLQVSE